MAITSSENPKINLTEQPRTQEWMIARIISGLTTSTKAALLSLTLSWQAIAQDQQPYVQLAQSPVSAGTINDIILIWFTPSYDWVLSGLGIARNWDTFALQNGNIINPEAQAQLDTFWRQTERFITDFTWAIEWEAPINNLNPRAQAETPSMLTLAEIFQGLTPEELIGLITSYTPSQDTEASIRQVFSQVLPPHLWARRAELEERYGQSMIAALRMQDNPQYTELHETEWLYLTVLTALIERSGYFDTDMTQELFYQLLDDIDREMQNGTYAEVDRFELMLAGVYDRLMKGEWNINQRMFTIIEPVLREEYARLHPELQEFYEARVENIRTTEERQRTAEERQRTAEERQRIAKLREEYERTLQILWISSGS